MLTVYIKIILYTSYYYIQDILLYIYTRYIYIQDILLYTRCFKCFIYIITILQMRKDRHKEAK